MDSGLRRGDDDVRRARSRSPSPAAGLRGAAVGLAAALAVAAVLGGCQGMSARPQPPEVAVRSVQVQKLAFPEVRFTLGLAVDNPNRYDLAVDALEVNLAVEGASFVSGALTAPVVLAPGRVTAVDLEMRTSIREWGVVLERIARSLSARYEVTGTVTLDGGLALPFRRSGTLPAIELPGARR